MFCPIPWLHLAIRNNGDIRVCVSSNQGEDSGILRKEDRTPYNAKTDNIEKSRNSSKIKEIRKYILNNKFHPECIRCENEFLTNLSPKSKYEMEYWENILSKEYIKKHTNIDGSIDTEKFPLRFLDVRFGNKCNSSCRMCGPTDSSQWYKYTTQIWNKSSYIDAGEKINIIKTNDKYSIDKDIYNWYKTDNFRNYLEYNIDKLSLIHIVGGEPLIVKEHYLFLEYLINKGVANNITLKYNTNGTIMNKYILNLWSKFKKVKLGISIDGNNLVNDYIRYPSKLSQVLDNMQKVNINNIEMTSEHTLSALNILYLPNFLDFISDFSINNFNKYNTFGAIHPVHGPEYFNIKIFPLEIKHKIEQYLNEYIFNEKSTTKKKILKKYIDFMFQEHLDENHYKTFLQITKRMDVINKQSIKTTIPLLYNLIKKDYDVT